MDALSLVLPATTIANPGSNGAEGGGLDAGSETATVEFATLLAAGLMPQQDPAQLLVVPAAAQAAEPATEKPNAQAPTDASLAARLPLASSLHASVMTQSQLAPREDAVALATPLAPTAGGLAADGAGVAAQAATIAAGAAAEQAFAAAATAGSRSTDAPLDVETHDHASADAATALGHPLHFTGMERTAASQPTAVLDVPASVHGPDFAQALSQQVVWMADKDAQVAELRIDPPELGPVEVRLEISGDEATVQFASAHAEVRDAIEAAIARLRESMAQAGIQLGQASVSAESFREQAAEHFAGGESRDGQRGNREQAEPAWQRAPLPNAVRRGLIDLFA